MMIRKITLAAISAAGLLAGAADAGTKGPLTFDFQEASDRMFPKREGVGGNLFKVEDGASSDEVVVTIPQLAARSVGTVFLTEGK